MRSRPSEGSGRTIRSIPAARYRSRVAGSALPPNTETEMVFGSRPWRSARARRSASWARTASAPARPRGNQPSQNSTTRLSVCGALAAQEDGRVRLLHRLGIGPDAVEADELPVELRLLLGPDLLHGQHPLAHHPEARREGGPVMLDLLDVPAGAHAEEEASVGEEVEAGHLLRGDDRIVLDHQADAGAEAEPRRHGRRRRQPDEGVQGVRVLLRQRAASRARACGGSPGCGCARSRRATRDRAPRGRAPGRRCGSSTRSGR